MNLERAIENVEKMANGINPLTNELLPTTSLLNNIEISRSLFYLLNIVKNGKKSNNSKQKFFITRAELNKYKYTQDLTISEFVNYINSLKNVDDTKKLKFTALANWLVSIGMLVEVEEGNKKRKIPSEYGEKIGIYRQTRNGYYGTYDVNLYDKYAQNFIIDNFEDFLLFNQ